MSVALSRVAALSCGRSRTTVTGLVLAGLALVLASTRLVTYDEPLERDITAFAVIARELIEGRALYSEVWDHKPPAGVVTHALAMVAFGYGRAAIYALNVLAAVITLLAVHAAGRAMGGTTAGLWAAAFWTVVSGDLYVEGNQPNLEVFMNAALTWAFVLILRRRATPTPSSAVAPAALFALASLYKTVAIAPAAALALAWGWPPARSRGSRRPAIAAVLTVAVVGLATWTSVALYFLITGRFRDFIDAVFVYNRFYAGDIGRNVARLVEPDIYWPLQSAAPLAGLTAIGLILGLVAGARRDWFLLSAWGAGTALAVAIPGRFFPHYFQLCLPVLAVAGGLAVIELARLADRTPSLGHALAAGTLALLVIFQAPFYEFTPEDWSRAKYRDDIFVAERALARHLSGWLTDREVFYQFGGQPGLYFETGRRPPSGIIYASPLMSGPVKDRLGRRLIADLERDPPDLYIISPGTLPAPNGEDPVTDWLTSRYRPVPWASRSGGFRLYVRRGSPLEARALAGVGR